MIYTISSGIRNDKDKTKRSGRHRPLLIVLALVAISSVGFAIFKFSFREHSQEMHPQIDFKKKLKEVCANPLLPVPEYRGVESFFKYLTKPKTNHCYSWLEFGGEKVVIPTQEEKNCMDEIRKTKMICFNEEYQMTRDPCLIYSFTKDADQQFERDMHMFSCHVHVFDGKQIVGAEHVKRTEFWMEHAWDISEYPYDIPAKEENSSAKKDVMIKRRSLDFITHVLKHEGKKINFLKSDNEGREWILLKQIIAHHDLVDIQQIGVRVHFPTSVNKMTGTGRHEYFRELFEIFQGLACLGYHYILGRPAKYYRGAIKLPEIEKSYFVSYELNFAKVIK